MKYVLELKINFGISREIQLISNGFPIVLNRLKLVFNGLEIVSNW